MFRKPSWILKQDTARICLSELDCLYKETVSHLPVCVRSSYCESLIHRIKSDLECAACEDKRESLNQIILAAQNEIDLLTREHSP
jgi:hypothetical protein